MSDDEIEQQLRIELMQSQIDNNRLNMKRLEQEIRMENRKFFVQALIAFAATLAAGVAIGRFVVFHT